MQVIALWLILSAATYRVGRFIVLDTLIEGTRDKVMNWLESRPSMLTVKLVELLSCPFCISIWVGAGAVGLTMPFTAVPLPVWMWLASSTGALVFWHIIDSKDD